MSTIKSSSEDLTLNADGSNDIKFQSNGVEKASISSAGAFTSTTIDATKLTGEKRNYIIDGDFSQFPEGDKASVGHGAYGACFFNYLKSAGELVIDMNQSTDVPTIAESGHKSSYSLEIDVTTPETAVAASDYAFVRYMVTGTDWAAVHKRGSMTLSFWHKHTTTGTYCVFMTNNAFNRTQIKEYTQSVSDTWEKAEITFSVETSDSGWAFTEADIGMNLGFTLMAGTDRHATGDTWVSTTDYATSNQVFGCNDTTDFFRFSQVGLYLGSVAPTFTSPPISTVKTQVEYYIHRQDLDNSSGQELAMGTGRSGTDHDAYYRFPVRMRATPTMSYGAAATWSATGVAGGGTASTKHGPTVLGVSVTTGINVTNGAAHLMARDGTDTCFIQADARH